MGTCIHETIIVSVFGNSDRANEVYGKVKEIIERIEPALQDFLTPVYYGLNQFSSFAVMPSGRSYDPEGSEATARKEIAQFLQVEEEDFVCICYGDDIGGPARIGESSTDYLNRDTF